MTTEAQHAEAKPKRAKMHPMDINRNEADWTFVDTEVMKGAAKGWPYMAPEKPTKETFDRWVQWVSMDIFLNKTWAMVKQYAQTWWELAEKAAKGEDGKIDHNKALDVFKTLASEFSARGDSIPTLMGQIEEYTNLMTALDLEDPEFGVKFKEYAEEVKKIQAVIATKRRDKDEKEETPEPAGASK